MAEKVPSWLERVLLPQISEVKGELKAVSGRIDRLDGRMEGEFKAVHSEIKRLDEKVEGLEKRMDITQRVAVIETKVHELEARK
jgi:predicted nuclease with TOPRIM domain